LDSESSTGERDNARSKGAEAQGLPATPATTAEQFHQQFEAAMSIKGPHLIEAQNVQNLQPASAAVDKLRVP